MADIARAYTVAREVFQMRPLWSEIENLDTKVAADVQMQMLLEGRRVIERAARWLLRNRRRPLDIAETVAYFAPGAAQLYEDLPRLLAVADTKPIVERAEVYEEAGVPPEV